MIYHCQHCKTETQERVTRCPNCNAFKPWKEGRAPNQGHVLRLSDVREAEVIRVPISPELDEALDGGVVRGGVYLMGGEPGIGKSTLTLQTLGKLADQNSDERGMYVSAEEAGIHIKARATRIGVDSTRIHFLEETKAEKITAAIEEIKPTWLIIDSISAIQVEGLSRGSVQGQREYITSLYEYAHKVGMGVIVVCHYTKDGELAGPKALEHAVDAVCSFEGERKDRLRVVYTQKNRFGDTPRMGLFEMSATGLKDVANAGSALFRGSVEAPGSVLGAAWVNGRCLLVEVQALMGTVAEKPRTVVTGLSAQRIGMIRAILERFGRPIAAGRDMYVNVVGGLKVDDPCLDLPIALALASAETGITINRTNVYCGEMGLLGEILEGPRWEDRKRMSLRAQFELKSYESIEKALEANIFVQEK